MFMNKYFVSFACLLLIGCGRANRTAAVFVDPSENDSIPAIDLSEPELDRIPKFSEVFDSVRFIPLETRDDALIGRIDKILAVDNKYVILDGSQAKAVFVFDNRGRFLNRIGRVGRGPQEYEAPNEMAYDPYRQEIIINNNNRQVLMFYKLDGTFVREVPVDFYFGTLGVVDANTIALYLNNRGRGEKDHNLVLINREGRILNRLLPIDRKVDLLSPPCKDAFFSYDGALQFAPRYSRTVYRLDANSLTPRYRTDFGHRNIPYGLLEGITGKDFDKALRESGRYLYSSATAETADHRIFRLVNYNRMVYDCYYSKVSGRYFAAANWVNDLYGLVSNGVFFCTNGDWLVSAIEPGSIVPLQQFTKEWVDGRSNIRERIIENFRSISSRIALSDARRRNYIEAWKSSDFNLSPEEVDFINRVDESDNPVLRLAKLKKF